VDSSLLTDPLVIGGVLKVVGAAIALVMAIPFIIGLVIGWFVGKAV
jgi:hypothetical protein